MISTIGWWAAGVLGVSGLGFIAWLVSMLIHAGENKEKAKNADKNINASQNVATAAIAEAQRQANTPATPVDTIAVLRARAEAKRKRNKT